MHSGSSVVGRTVEVRDHTRVTIDTAMSYEPPSNQLVVSI